MWARKVGRAVGGLFTAVGAATTVTAVAGTAFVQYRISKMQVIVHDLEAKAQNLTDDWPTLCDMVNHKLMRVVDAKRRAPVPSDAPIMHDPALLSELFGNWNINTWNCSGTGIGMYKCERWDNDCSLWTLMHMMTMRHCCASYEGGTIEFAPFADPVPTIVVNSSTCHDEHHRQHKYDIRIVGL